MKAFIERAYGLEINSFSGLGSGFYGETWRMDATSGRYIAKLDRWPTHSREFRDNLLMLEQINECGLEYVPALLHGKNGERCFEYDGGVLALFEYMDGEPTENFRTEELFEKLGQVYARCPAPQMPAGQLFTMEQYERVCRLTAMLDRNSIEGSAIIGLLSEKKALIEERALRLEFFMERCAKGSYPTVMTHGDAGGNCVMNGEQLAIIDWDTAKFSVPERDAWAHMSSEENIRLIEKGLSAGGFDYRLQQDAFGFFANSWFFEYLGNYLQCAADAVEDRQMDMYEGMKEYFDCWIFEVLKLADRLA